MNGAAAEFKIDMEKVATDMKLAPQDRLDDLIALDEKFVRVVVIIVCSVAHERTAVEVFTPRATAPSPKAHSQRLLASTATLLTTTLNRDHNNPP